MFDVRAFPRVGPLTQRLEQGTRNSRKRFCACFTALRSVADARCSAFHIRAGLRRIARFCSKNFTDRTKRFWNLSLFPAMKEAKTKSQQNTTCDYQVTTK